MPDTPDEAIAALNNAEWCAAVWRSHGLPVDQTHGLWLCRRDTPQYYPNVVTVDPGADAASQAAFIADLRRSDPDLDLSVKDSFAALDLGGSGLKPLFDARWMVRPAQGGQVAGATLDWRRITNEPQLAAWENAWRGRAAPGTRIFLDRLLQDPRAWVLGGCDARGSIRAGGIAYEAAGVLGLTNVFGAAGQFVRVLGELRPGIPMVCYAPGNDHRSAESAGFQVLGPLRVWVRDMDFQE